jgi:hypothetical protein
VVEDKSGGNDQNTLHACMRSLQWNPSKFVRKLEKGVEGAGLW